MLSTQTSASSFSIPGQAETSALLPKSVPATHVLTQTGTCEQTGYAIEDAPETVAKHSGRFPPGDEAAVSAQILNRVRATRSASA